MNDIARSRTRWNESPSLDSAKPHGTFGSMFLDRITSTQIKVAVVLAAAALIFYPDLIAIGSDALVSDYYNYVLVLPLLIFILLYSKRKTLDALATVKDSGYGNQIIAASLFAIALLAYLYGTYTPDPIDYHLVALVIFLGAAILILFNRATLRVAVPSLLLVAAAIPAVVLFGLNYWLDVATASSYGAYLILSAFGLPVSVTTVLGVPAISLATPSGPLVFGVELASSGVYALIGFVVFAGFVSYIGKGPTWKKIVLFSLGFPLLLGVNIVRIAILVVAANLWGLGVFEIFHLTSGIVLVSIVSFGLLVLGDRVFKISFYTKTIPGACEYCSAAVNQNFCINCGRFLRNTALKLGRSDVIPFVSLAIVTLLFLASIAPAFVSASSPTYIGLDDVTPQNANAFLPSIPNWNLTYTGNDTQAANALNLNAALVYTYVQNNSTNPFPPQFFTTIEISQGFHNPETSIIRGAVFDGTSNNILQDSDVQLLANPPLIGRFLAYQQNGVNNTITNLYWTFQSSFNISDSIVSRNVQISIASDTNSLAAEGAISNSSDLQATLAFFLPFAKQIIAYWNPIGINSFIQLTTSALFLPLATVAVIPSVVVAGRIASEKRKESRAIATTYRSMLSEGEKRVLSSIIFSNKSYQNVDSIKQDYREFTGKEISVSDIYAELLMLESMGLVKRSIIEIQNEPRVLWKVNGYKRQKTVPSQTAAESAAVTSDVIPSQIEIPAAESEMDSASKPVELPIPRAQKEESSNVPEIQRIYVEALNLAASRFRIKFKENASVRENLNEVKRIAPGHDAGLGIFTKICMSTERYYFAKVDNQASVVADAQEALSELRSLWARPD